MPTSLEDLFSDIASFYITGKKRGSNPGGAGDDHDPGICSCPGVRDKIK
jgi:hypothetical protein